MSRGKLPRPYRCSCGAVVRCRSCGTTVLSKAAAPRHENRYNRNAGHGVLMLFEEVKAFEEQRADNMAALMRGGAPSQFVAFPDGGGYPFGFLEKAYKVLGVTDQDRVLHLCSGSMRTGIRVDVRPQMKPTVVADCRRTPFRDESFRWILADPPYGESYAEEMYGVGKHYPGPGQILLEAARLLVPGGRFGLLHFIPPPAMGGLEQVGIWAVSTGAGYAIRAFTVFEKPGPGLFGPQHRGINHRHARRAAEPRARKGRRPS